MIQAAFWRRHRLAKLPPKVKSKQTSQAEQAAYLAIPQKGEEESKLIEARFEYVRYRKKTE